jgi:DNA-directed RNA polymerase subunit RPC12/RpoP
MGSQVFAICKCGVNKKLRIGGGRMSYMEINYFPALCPHCYDIVQTNLRDENLTCPDCNNKNTVPYNNPKLIGLVGQEIVDRSYLDILTDGTYYCSKCENKSLRFERGTLLWD